MAIVSSLCSELPKWMREGELMPSQRGRLVVVVVVVGVGVKALDSSYMATRMVTMASEELQSPTGGAGQPTSNNNNTSSSSNKHQNGKPPRKDVGSSAAAGNKAHIAGADGGSSNQRKERRRNRPERPSSRASEASDRGDQTGAKDHLSCVTGPAKEHYPGNRDVTAATTAGRELRTDEDTLPQQQQHTFVCAPPPLVNPWTKNRNAAQVIAQRQQQQAQQQAQQQQQQQQQQQSTVSAPDQFPDALHSSSTTTTTTTPAASIIGGHTVTSVNSKETSPASSTGTVPLQSQQPQQQQQQNAGVGVTSSQSSSSCSSNNSKSSNQNSNKSVGTNTNSVSASRVSTVHSLHQQQQQTTGAVVPSNEAISLSQKVLLPTNSHVAGDHNRPECNGFLEVGNHDNAYSANDDNTVGVQRSSHHSSSPGGGRGSVVVSQTVNTSVAAMSEWPTLGEVVAEEPISSGPTSSNGSSVASPKAGSGRDARGSRFEKASERAERGGDRGNGDHDDVSSYDASHRNIGGGSNAKSHQGGVAIHGASHGGSSTHTNSGAGTNVSNSTSTNAANSHSNSGGNNNSSGGNNSSYAINKKKGAKPKWVPLAIEPVSGSRGGKAESRREGGYRGDRGERGDRSEQGRQGDRSERGMGSGHKNLHGGAHNHSHGGHHNIAQNPSASQGGSSHASSSGHGNQSVAPGGAQSGNNNSGSNSQQQQHTGATQSSTRQQQQQHGNWQVTNGGSPLPGAAGSGSLNQVGLGAASAGVNLMNGGGPGGNGGQLTGVGQQRESTVRVGPSGGPRNSGYRGGRGRGRGGRVPQSNWVRGPAPSVQAGVVPAGGQQQPTPEALEASPAPSFLVPIIPSRLPLTPSPPPAGQFIATAPLAGAVVVSGAAPAPTTGTAASIAQMPPARYGFLGASFLTVDEATLKEYIRKQVEYYFSEENLQRDFFLRRNMDREGFLPVTLVAGFHRIQALTQDISLFIKAVKESTQLELRDNVKLRTRERPTYWPLPDVPNGASPLPPQMAPANATLNASAVAPGPAAQDQQDPTQSQQQQTPTAASVVINGA
ncbi:la-related protein 1-like [Tropilaelaps mercedesae]|uniref:La-related protein 1 n=1 Tax=Tropilaelaps mercedesae TaxID=418985 RepID=A0A1V9X6Q8_9ACAR|nr:la-related protein 1-like [Tropilaelaps mercedesae]